MSSLVSAEKIENELKSATIEQLQKNREVRANYWREVSLTMKAGPFPLESFFLFLLFAVFPSMKIFLISFGLIVFYTYIQKKGLTIRRFFDIVQSILRGKKMTRNVTMFGYNIR